MLGESSKKKTRWDTDKHGDKNKEYWKDGILE
jgi:hypothetical protein